MERRGGGGGGVEHSHVDTLKQPPLPGRVEGQVNTSEL